MPLCPQELGTCEQAPLLLSSLSLHLPAPDLLPSCFRQFPDRGVPLPKTKLPHLSTTGPKPCKPFHLMSASPLEAVDLQSAGILKPLLGASGSFGPQKRLLQHWKIFAPRLVIAQPPSAIFPSHFSPALVFHPLTGNFSCCPATRKIVSGL